MKVLASLSYIVAFLFSMQSFIWFKNDYLWLGCIIAAVLCIIMGNLFRIEK